MSQKLLLTSIVIAIALIVTAIAAFIHSNASSEVKKAFIENEIVPDILNSTPKKIIYVSYRSGVSVNLGNELTPTQVKDVPVLSWEAEKGAYYTLVMTDPDSESRANPTRREIRHWLVFNILECDVKSGDEVVEYVGSGARNGTGLHRYIFLVFGQPNGRIKHDEPHVSKRSRALRRRTSVSALTTKYNLCGPVFGNFFQAQYDPYVDILQAQSIE